MSRYLQNALNAVGVGAVFFFCHSAPAGTITGTVESISGEPTSGAVVLITEAELGLPLNSDGTTSPKSDAGKIYPLSTQTSADGKFEFKVPDGKYNLFAQIWQGKLIPVTRLPLGDIPFYSDTVSAQGSATGVTVPSTDAQNVHLKPAGSCTVQLRFDSPNDDSFAVLSTAPPELDPVFGFAGWMGKFAENAIAVNRVPKGKMDFHNVPAGQVYIAVFANDNKAGFGTAHVYLEDAQTTTVPLQFVAGWSNGKKTPPSELADLYQKFETSKWTIKDLPTLPKIPFSRIPDPVAKRKLLIDDNPTITLPDGTTASAKDVWTVLLYLQLNRQ